MVSLDIFSDPICPWCLIGKTKLDRALAAHEGETVFAIRWHPFQLNPSMPAEGMGRQEYLDLKFGGRDRANQIYGGIAAAADEAGVEIDFSAITRTPNTLDAHRLIHWAEIEGAQTRVVDALFNAYFREGRDIGDREVLADIADSAGLDAAMVQRLFATDADIDEIRSRDATAREMGIEGVPCFIVAGKHAVPGAQATELWTKVIDELASATT
ncbi:MAG: DsbA family oxidoreductase [Pseudomonadota bacterium]